MVTQETAMFNRSARDNILYGRPDATEAEMIEAARKAEAHDFILELQDHRGREGYEAHLGERGVKLSGGQRQRIALARAILKDAPILSWTRRPRRSIRRSRRDPDGARAGDGGQDGACRSRTGCPRCRRWTGSW
jgi:ABC-type molybdate transport system ATPase subunit